MSGCLPEFRTAFPLSSVARLVSHMRHVYLGIQREEKTDMEREREREGERERVCVRESSYRGHGGGGRREEVNLAGPVPSSTRVERHPRRRGPASTGYI